MDVARIRQDGELEGHNPFAVTVDCFEEIETRLTALEHASDGGQAVATLRAELPELIRAAVESLLAGETKPAKPAKADKPEKGEKPEKG